MIKNNRGAYEGCIVMVLVFIIGAVIGGFVWPYTLNTWLHFFHKPQHISFWQGALIGFVPVIGTSGILCAFITWVLMMFIGNG